MKIFEKAAAGLGFGLLCVPIFYFLGCWCQCYAELCNNNRNMPTFMWSWSAFFNSILIFCAAGAVIGAIYGFSLQYKDYSDRKEREENYKEEAKRKDKIAREEKELKQRQQYAYEFKQKANRTVEQCNLNKDNGDMVIPQPDYKGISLQSELWNALNDASIPLQKLENIVSEFSAKKEDK